MQFEVLEENENKLIMRVLDADDSVMYPIMEQLLEDDRVKDSNYSVAHQELDEPILTLETKENEDPKQILIDITNNIKSQFIEAYNQIFSEEGEE
ncbi:MAG: RpoL/Rpb11 RNA polymerase subunit family protein [Thermoplasmatota archaeon]